MSEESASLGTNSVGTASSRSRVVRKSDGQERIFCSHICPRSSSILRLRAPLSTYKHVRISRCNSWKEIVRSDRTNQENWSSGFLRVARHLHVHDDCEHQQHRGISTCHSDLYHVPPVLRETNRIECSRITMWLEVRARHHADHEFISRPLITH